jgi:hypothetical protein
VLDRELNALPERYKAPVVLCDLEGKTRREAARQLGVSEGTLSSRLARARRLLAKRLTRQGLSLSGGALATVLVEEAASAAVPAPWVVSTVRAATAVAAGRAAVTTPAALLMNEVVKAMLMTKLKLVVAGVMVVALGASGLLYRAAGQSEGKPAGKPRNEAEALRHEVELLKFNLEVVLEKCRAQEAELRALRGRVQAAAGAKGVGPEVAVFDAAGVQDVLVARDSGQLVVKNVLVTPTAEQEVEAALKAFREAKDNEAKRRAAEKLEGALRKLRQQLQPKDQGQAPKTP